MTEPVSRKVVDMSCNKIMFTGTWAQCVNYCVHNKLGTYREHGWLGHVLNMAERYVIQEVTQ